jgi:hypothetical protein
MLLVGVELVVVLNFMFFLYMRHKCLNLRAVVWVYIVFVLVN